MIQYADGDILQADVEALVNTVNCVGIMGRGIALQFKKNFPSNYREYYAACKKNQVEPGRMFVHQTGTLANPRVIINFPTKRHWREKSRLEDIEAGLSDLERVIKEYGITSIAIPPLGCGLGGLAWDDVRARIESVLKSIESVRILIFTPKGTPAAADMPASKSQPSMTVGRAALISLMHQYLQGLLDPYVTLLEVHKLMYFLQEAGEPLKLRYKKAQYGPYAENLHHVLHAIEGHYISGYGDGRDMLDKELTLLPSACENAEKLLEDYPETNARFKRVTELIYGFESSFGLELLSTVYWVITNENVKTPEEIQTAVYAWNERKKQFSPRQIELAADVLKEKKWVSVYSGLGFTEEAQRNILVR